MLRRTFVKNLSAAAGVAALGGLSRVTAAPPKIRLSSDTPRT
ncbi:twin-arginine translocation signal domain-containing protein [Siphonobacter sp. BAB-5385]